MKSSIYCEHPVIIRNKSIWKYIKPNSKPVYTDGEHTYILHYFQLPSQLNVTVETINKFHLVTSDGELIPLYIQVPCGKCLLCRNKKKSSWVTRCRCESMVAQYPPIFVTLTFQDKFLPEYGLHKKHVQNFLKRFRINYQRHVGKILDLRYIACGEYGMDETYTHRPHYHLLMWNVPFQTEIDKLNCFNMLAKSWSVNINYQQISAIPFKFLHLELNNRHYELFGKIDVQQDNGSSDNYVTKYILKESCFPSNDPAILCKLGKPFFLSSRGKGGIGLQYIRERLDEYRSKTALNVKIKDKEYSLPPNFKNILYPSISQLISSDMLYQLFRLKYLIDYYNKFINQDFYYELKRSYTIDIDSEIAKRERIIQHSIKLLDKHKELLPYVSTFYHQDVIPLKSKLSEYSYNDYIYIDKSVYSELVVTYFIVKLLVSPKLVEIDLSKYIDLKQKYIDEIAYRYREDKLYDIDAEVYKLQQLIAKHDSKSKLHRK